MNLYLDTSVMIAALTNKPGGHAIQAWLASEPELAISDWVVAEFSSALAIKLRTGHLTLEQRSSVLAVFSRLANETFAVVPVDRAHFRAAALFVDQHTLGLRAGDALHLAICADHGATLCTLDRRLAEAGPHLGVPTHLL